MCSVTGKIRIQEKYVSEQENNVSENYVSKKEDFPTTGKIHKWKETNNQSVKKRKMVS